MSPFLTAHSISFQPSVSIAILSPLLRFSTLQIPGKIPRLVSSRSRNSLKAGRRSSPPKRKCRCRCRQTCTHPRPASGKSQSAGRRLLSLETGAGVHLSQGRRERWRCGSRETWRLELAEAGLGFDWPAHASFMRLSVCFLALTVAVECGLAFFAVTERLIYLTLKDVTGVAAGNGFRWSGHLVVKQDVNRELAHVLYCWKGILYLMGVWRSFVEVCPSWMTWKAQPWRDWGEMADAFMLTSHMYVFRRVKVLFEY